MTSPTSEAEIVEVEVFRPHTRDESCDGKTDDKLADITKVALQMFGELAELSTHERVEILMVRHGWRQADVARALGVSWQNVSQHWAKICDELDIETLPSRQRAMMARQYEAQYQRASRMADPTRGIPMALKALELRAKLLGLNLETQATGGEIAPYKTPEEIAETVRAHLLTIHGRESFLTPSPATGAGGTSESASSRPETKPP